MYDPALTKATAAELTKALTEGYGNIEIDWNTPDYDMLQKLTENVFQFSAAKSYQQLEDITRLLKDENGKLREFNDFQGAVKDLGYKYNRDWLQTEYQTAVSSATSAARWVEFKKESAIFPFLKYQTVGDDRVRSEHQALDGTVKHVNDPFWKTYYPPNGWNCRCEALQVPESGAKEVQPRSLPSVPSMFRTNLAESGLIFPKNHPFYTGVPKDILRRAMQYIPQNNAFRTMQAGKDFFFQEHAMLQNEPEAKENRSIAKLLSKAGNKDVRLMPRLHEKEAEIRRKLYGNDYVSKHPTKCPDAFANGKPVEFKSATQKKMSKRILEASKQADIVVLKCKEDLTSEYIERFVNGQWNMTDRDNVNQIIIVNKGKLQVFKRP